MHDVLALSEILRSVFKFTDEKTDVSSVRVCKAWHEVVLDVIWYRVDRLDGLFKLLGPMGEMGYGLLTFVHYHISSERWERFSFYANRVRELECTQYPAIHHNSFSIVSISRPALYLLPNLTHLTWKKDPARPAASLTLCLLFLTPNLKSLSVEAGLGFSHGDLFAIDNFFHDVALRSPRIERIDFRSEIPFHKMGPVLSNFVTSLPCLKYVQVSDSLLTSDVVTALAKCSDLEVVQITDPEPSQESSDLENFMPVLEDGAFPSIKAISFKAHLWNATHFLQSAFPASRLRSLQLRTLRYESYENINNFFAVVAEACPSIEGLVLAVDFTVEGQENEPIPFSALEPLLQCRSLAQFSLVAPSPLDMDDAQAAFLASHWPKMELLNLNPSPIPRHPEKISLTLMAMSSFATHCPSLQFLGICVRPLVVPALEACTHLPKLTTFKVSLSDHNFDSEELALFLTNVLPSTCKMEGRAVYPMLAHVDRAVHAHFARTQLKLEKTLALLPTLRRIHHQYIERLGMLEDEVQRLRTTS